MRRGRRERPDGVRRRGGAGRPFPRRRAALPAGGGCRRGVDRRAGRGRYVVPGERSPVLCAAAGPGAGGGDPAACPGPAGLGRGGTGRGRGAAAGLRLRRAGPGLGPEPRPPCPGVAELGGRPAGRVCPVKRRGHRRAVRCRAGSWGGEGEGRTGSEAAGFGGVAERRGWGGSGGCLARPQRRAVRGGCRGRCKEGCGAAGGNSPSPFGGGGQRG